MRTAALTAPPSLRDRIEGLMPRVRYRRAVTAGDREAIFRMRHAAYLREGAIAPRPRGLFFDEVDDAANTVLVAVHVDGRIAGSIRISIATPLLPEIPTAKVFPEFLLPEIAAGRVIVDPTRFVGDREISREIPELPYLTLRVPWLAMEHFGADLMLAAVRPEHQAFYRRLWGNETVCPPRPYPALARPVALTVLDYARARDTVHDRHPYFRSTAAERTAIFGDEPGSARAGGNLPSRSIGESPIEAVL